MEKYIAFRNASRLYNLSLTLFNISTTAHIAYMVSAVEALGKAEKNKFSDFVRKLVDDFDEDLLDFIYGKVRSGHYHSGEFPFLEYDVEKDNPINHGFINVRNDLIKVKEILRKCLRNGFSKIYLKKSFS